MAGRLQLRECTGRRRASFRMATARGAGGGPSGGAGATTDASALDMTSAVETAKAWYDHDRRSPSQGNYTMVVPVLGAYRNSGTEWSLLYRIEPRPGHEDPGTTFLWRYKFTRAGSAWKVASAGEENACMHLDDEESDIPGLDATTAVKAAKRWYDKHFYGGAYSMSLPHVGAYCNRANGFPRLWSVCYRATGSGVDPQMEHFVQFKYAAQKKGGGWKWRAVSLDATGSREVDVGAPAPAPAAATKEVKQTKRPRLTVGSTSESDHTASDKKKRRVALTVGSLSVSSSAVDEGRQTTTSPAAAKQQPKSRVALTVGSSSSSSSGVEKGRKITISAGAAKRQAKSHGEHVAVALDKESALKGAKAWFEKEQPDEEMIPLKIHRNNDRECSLLYRTEPNATGNTFLHRFKFAPPSDMNEKRWTIKSRPYEDDAAMYEDTIGPPEANELDELDEHTAIKAAKRWYDEYFDAGGNEMDMPVLAAYRNTEPNIELNEAREWSLKYTANGDPTEHFVRFKYRAELNKKGWKWTAYGYSEDDEPSEHIGNSVEGYQNEQFDYAQKKRGAGSKKRAADRVRSSSGSTGLKSKGRSTAKNAISDAPDDDKPADTAAVAAASSTAKSSHNKKKQARAVTDVGSATRSVDMKAKIREPKGELLQLPYMMPSAACDDGAYRGIGGPKVDLQCPPTTLCATTSWSADRQTDDDRLSALWCEHAARAQRHRALEEALMACARKRQAQKLGTERKQKTRLEEAAAPAEDALDDELARRIASHQAAGPSW